MARNTIWEGLWEDIEGDTITVKIPRDLAETLIAALSAGIDSGDMDMDGGSFALDLDPDFDDDMGDEIPGSGDADGGMVLLHGDGDDSDSDSDNDDSDSDDFGGGDDDEEDEEEDDDEDDKKKKSKDEASTYARSGGNPSGMRPKTAIGESKRSPFKVLKRKIQAKSAAPARKK